MTTPPPPKPSSQPFQAEMALVAQELLEVTIGRYQVVCHDPRLIGDFVALTTDEIHRILQSLVAITAGHKHKHGGSHHNHPQSAASNGNNKSQRASMYEGTAGATSTSDVSASKGVVGESIVDFQALSLSNDDIADPKATSFASADDNSEEMQALVNKLQTVEAENASLKGKLQRREIMINEQRQAYLRELLVTKEMMRQLQSRGKSDLTEVTMNAWNVDPLNDAADGDRAKLESMLEEMRLRNEKERDNMTQHYKGAIDDLKKQLTSATQILARMASKRDVSTDTSGLMMTLSLDEFAQQTSAPISARSTHSNPQQQQPINCPHCGRSVASPMTTPRDEKSSATKPHTPVLPSRAGSFARSARERERPLGVEVEIQTSPVEFAVKVITNNIAIQTMKELKAIIAHAAVQTVGPFSPVDIVEEEEQEDQIDEKDMKIESLEKEIAQHKASAAKTKEELQMLKDMVFNLKAKMLEDEGSKHLFASSATTVSEYKEELRAKEDALIQKGREIENLQKELNNVLQYHSNGNVVQSPGPGWNMPALMSLRQSVRQAEQLEGLYRITTWRSFMISWRHHMMKKTCLQEWQAHHTYSHDVVETRRLERNADILDLHFKRKATQQKHALRKLKDNANAAWDQVLFAARAVIHVVQVDGMNPDKLSPRFSPRVDQAEYVAHIPPPTSIPHHMYSAGSTHPPHQLRPASAPSRDREPTPLRPVILEASVPAGTAIGLRNPNAPPAHQRPQSAGVRKGTNAIQPMAAGSPHDPKTLLMKEMSMKKQRLRETVDTIRMQALSCDPSVVGVGEVGGLAPIHRRLLGVKKDSPPKKAGSASRPASAKKI